MKKRRISRCVFYTFLVGLTAWLSACSDWIDDYEMNDHEPDYLKASIYDYLKNDGHYTYFTRIIDMTEEDGIKYKEVLSRTGSKTLFVADDAAFREFFANNNMGITKFEDFSIPQCRSILFGGMLNNPYLLSMLTYAAGNPPKMGQVMRREASLPLLDTVLLKKGDEIPDNPYWATFKENGLYLLDDITNYTLVHFLPTQMRMQGITDDDFKTMTGITRSGDDAYLFDIKIVQKDIICKNGYIHRLEKLLLPRETMAEYIRSNPNTKLFNGFLERYAFPALDPGRTAQYKSLHPDFNGNIYVKWFINTHTGGTNQKPSFAPTEQWPTDLKAFLKFNPGEKSYQQSSTSLQTDMAAIFVPTDDALKNYFDNTPTGQALKDHYGSWEKVPDDVLDVLINHHMRESFLGATPGRFGELADKMGTKMNVKPEDVVGSRICSNGIVYVTNQVYAPTEYIAVTAPVLMGEKTTLFKWIMRQLQFAPYLMSMEEGNRYSFFVPADDSFDNYVDPGTVSFDGTSYETLKFSIDPLDNKLVATRTNQDGVVVNPPWELKYAADAINTDKNNRLYKICMDIMDNHIVLEDIKKDDDKKYFRTKAGGTIVVTGRGDAMRLAGGANIDREESIAVLDNSTLPMDNGTTYFINHVLQAPLKSTYHELNKPEFSKFLQLCLDVRGVPETGTKEAGGNIFGGSTGIDLNVRFFNTFNYTVYVPTNDAIDQAITDGLIKDWSAITALENTNHAEYLKEAQNLYDFLSYHFQDNSVYVGDKLTNKAGVIESKTYETATLDRKAPNPPKFPVGEVTGKFKTVTVSADGNQVTVKGLGNAAPLTVTTTTGLYNVMARDYQLSTSKQISTSSFVVIHQIDGVLRYK